MKINQNQFEFNASINQIYSDKKEQLNPFVEQFVANHSYFKSRDVAIEYLYDKHRITLNDLTKDREIILFLTKRIAKLLKPYRLSGTIEKYNSTTYQVIK